MRTARLLVACATLAGCFESQLFDCGDKVCPVGYVCTPTQQCLSPAEVDACRGLVDGDPCDAGDGVVGECREGGCAVAFCGNGIIDGGEVCDDGNQRNGDGCNGTCSSDETCGNGFVEIEEACDCGDVDHPGPVRCMGTFNGDAICTTTCQLRRCGDGVQDPDEVCDDGNQVAGDGCNFDCSSSEVCGNGVLDYFVGEQCDDGARINRDGCSATCRGEQLTWQRMLPASIPPTGRCPMGYDAARQRAVVLAGSACNETWELLERTWVRAAPTQSPPNRNFSAMVYDSERARLVVFGGVTPNTTNGQLDDTWEYDGTTWTKRSTATKPTARERIAMAYDRKRKRVVVYGGQSGAGQSSDTWEYDGTNWVLRTFGGMTPGLRHGAAMTYDAKRGVTVLYGGFRVGPGTLADTWEYDGTSWSAITPSGAPGAREAANLVWDATRERVVLFGGAGASSFDDAWEYDGTTWSPITATSKPSKRRDAAMAYVGGARPRIVLFGGFDGAGPLQNDTHELVGTAWAPVLQVAPSARDGAAVAYDTRRGRLVLFGGTTGAAQTWEFGAETGWELRAPTTSPPARDGAAMAYDRANDRIVMFGGVSGSTYRDDTWTYDGTTWTLLTTTTPSARTNATMVYDPSRQALIMFGGRYATMLGASVWVDETWELDGSTWTNLTLTSKPSPRELVGLAWDEANSRMVLFGGRLSGTVYNDLYRLDATTWTQLTPTVSPPPLFFATLAYDPGRRRVLAFNSTSFDQEVVETWQLNDQPLTWTMLDPATPPSGRKLFSLAFDVRLGRTVLFGGSNAGSVSSNETWTLGYAPIVAGEACSSAIDYDADGSVGCLDPECAVVCTGCGDAVCSPLEDCRSCPGDCMVGGAGCPIDCGDTHCDPPETSATCPGDCP